MLWLSRTVASYRILVYFVCDVLLSGGVIVCFVCQQRFEESVAEDFEEGGFFDQEYQEQGQVADQGKPSIWSYPFVLLFFLLSMFYLC